MKRFWFSYGRSTRRTDDRLPTCPDNGTNVKPSWRYRLLPWLFSGMGLIALFWFLLRVIPKPSRAAYPCQRAAFPLASSFVIWLVGLPVLAFARRKFNERHLRLWKACAWGGTAFGVLALLAANLPALLTRAANPLHAPQGCGSRHFSSRTRRLGPRARRHELGGLYIDRTLV